MVFYESLNDIKSPQIFRILLRILTDLKNAVVVWMFSTCPLISKSSIPCAKSLMTVRITIGTTVTFMFHSLFFQFFSKVELFSFHFAVFQFYPVVSQNRKVHYSASPALPTFCWLSLGLVVWARLDGPFVYQNPRKFCASYFLGQILGCASTTCSYGQI